MHLSIDPQGAINRFAGSLFAAATVTAVTAIAAGLNTDADRYNPIVLFAGAFSTLAATTCTNMPGAARFALGAAITLTGKLIADMANSYAAEPNCSMCP